MKLKYYDYSILDIEIRTNRRGLISENKIG